LALLQQIYDGQPKQVRVLTQPEGLPVEVTYSGSRTPPILPGLYSVVAIVRDPNIAGLVSGTMAISLPGYSLRLNPAYPMLQEEDSGAGWAVPTGEELMEVRGPDGSVQTSEMLRAQQLAVRLVFKSMPRDEFGKVRGHLERFEGGVWSQVNPSVQQPLVISIQEMEAGYLFYVPDADETGFRYAQWSFEAELLDAMGVRIATGVGGRMTLAVRNLPDAPEVMIQPEVSLGYGDTLVLGLNGLFQDRDPGETSLLRFRLGQPDPGIEARLSGQDLQLVSTSTQAGLANLGVFAIDPQGGEVGMNLRVTLLPKSRPANRPPTLSVWTLSEDGSAPSQMAELGSGPLVVNQPENRVPVLKVRGVDLDRDRLDYGLIGPDAALFTIDAEGWVKARAALDYEYPTDLDQSGRYRLAVTVRDDRGGQCIQPLEIQVRNVVEAPGVRPGRLLTWALPQGVSGIESEYRVSDYFINPEGGALSASLRNTEALASWGIQARLAGDRLTLQRIDAGEFPRQAILELSLTANGQIRLFEVQLMPDTDGDGIDDLTESMAGDRNQDGISDALQSTVASFPALNADTANAASYLCLMLGTVESGSKESQNRAVAGLTDSRVPVQIVAPRLDALSVEAAAEWRRALVAGGVGNLHAQTGLLGYALEPDLAALGIPVSEKNGPAARSAARSFSSVQHQVRVLLPLGTHINTCLKSDSNGARYEFLKAPVRDQQGRVRTDDQGQPLFTGAEFLSAGGDSPFDEVRIYLVDNERGDEDPTLGRILDPGVLAFVERNNAPGSPRIDVPVSPVSAGTFRLGGSAAAGVMVRLWEGGVLQAEICADALGQWQWKPVTPPAAGLHRYTASARGVAGSESLRSTETWVTIEVRLAAKSDLLNRTRQPVQRWRTSELLQNDVLQAGTPEIRILNARSELGGSVSLDGDWVVYRPAAELPETVADTFRYEVRAGDETSQAAVYVLGQPWTSKGQQFDVQWLPEDRGLQLRFNAAPGRRFQVMASGSLLTPMTWEELGQTDSDSAGRVLWLDSTVSGAQRYYRIELLP
jgi:hypothetical protein